jgi:hypothetical protein
MNMDHLLASFLTSLLSKPMSISRHVPSVLQICKWSFGKIFRSRELRKLTSFFKGGEIFRVTYNQGRYETPPVLTTAFHNPLPLSSPLIISITSLHPIHQHQHQHHRQHRSLCIPSTYPNRIYSGPICEDGFRIHFIPGGGPPKKAKTR